MDAVDETLRKYWQERPAGEGMMAGCAFYSLETAILKAIAPKSYSEEDLMSFVFYHLHGEQMPDDFFVQRREWLETKAAKVLEENK